MQAEKGEGFGFGSFFLLFFQVLSDVGEGGEANWNGEREDLNFFEMGNGRYRPLGII